MSAPLERGDSGFVMLEVIIAFTVLALGLAVAMQTISQGMGAVTRAADIEIASTILAHVEATELAVIEEAGTKQGAEGEARWQIQATPVSDGHAAPLYAVTVDVWPRGGSGSRFTYYLFRAGG